jgi:hypothetical protein
MNNQVLRFASSLASRLVDLGAGLLCVQIGGDNVVCCSPLGLTGAVEKPAGYVLLLLHTNAACLLGPVTSPACFLLPLASWLSLNRSPFSSPIEFPMS